MHRQTSSSLDGLSREPIFMISRRSLPHSGLPHFATPLHKCNSPCLVTSCRTVVPVVAPVAAEHRRMSRRASTKCIPHLPHLVRLRRRAAAVVIDMRKREQDVASVQHPCSSRVPRREGQAVNGPAHPARTVLAPGRSASSTTTSWCKLWFDGRCFGLGVTDVAVEPQEESMALPLRDASREVPREQPRSRSASRRGRRHRTHADDSQMSQVQAGQCDNGAGGEHE